MRTSHGVIAGALLAASLSFTPASAQSLLGGLLGDDDNSLITLNSGKASDSGLVNAGVGGGDGNVLDVNILPGSSGSAASANVGTGGNSALDADVRLLNNTVRANASVGGEDSLVDLDVGIGGGSNGSGNGNGNVTPVVPTPPGSNGTATGGIAAACAGQDASGIISLISQSDQVVHRWQNARGVEVVPVRFCQDIVQQLRNLANASNVGIIQSLIASDVLFNAALSRNGKNAGDVLAVDYSNQMLTVYVL